MEAPSTESRLLSSAGWHKEKVYFETPCIRIHRKCAVAHERMGSGCEVFEKWLDSVEGGGRRVCTRARA